MARSTQNRQNQTAKIPHTVSENASRSCHLLRGYVNVRRWDALIGIVGAPLAHVQISRQKEEVKSSLVAGPPGSVNQLAMIQTERFVLANF